MGEHIVFYAAPNELSCIVGNLFAELVPPCDVQIPEGALILCGRTAQGGKAMLMIYPTHCEFIGDSTEFEDLRMAHCLERGCTYDC